MDNVALFKEAINADLSKLQWTAWATVMMQTLCYGKLEDDLSDSRLTDLSGLRLDRARVAVRDVVGMGLIGIAGQGKYGTVYRIPERFLDDSGYIGFRANIGASETDAYADISELEPETTPHAGTETYAELLARYQQLLDAHQGAVNTIQELVATNRILVNGLPKNAEVNRKTVSALPENGEELTGKRLNATPISVTDINKPKHTKTTTTLNPDSGEEAEESPERWPENWGQVGQGVDDFQAWEQYAAMPDLSANQTPQPARPAPTPPVEIAATPHPVSRINAESLQYPEALTAEERVEAPKKLDGLHPQIAQEVLDALAWKIGSGTVRTPIGMLVHLANKAREGTFDRTPALEWRKGKQVAQAKQDGITLAELNMLANEVKALQGILKAGGENTGLATQIETMKATYFQKLEMYKAAQAGGMA